MSSEPRATVHLSHIVANWRTLAGLNPKADTAAVVKANAYGQRVKRWHSPWADGSTEN